MDDRISQSETTIGLDPAAPLDRFRDEFERHWNDAAPTRIEALLTRVPDTERGPLLESMIALEVRLRRGAGEAPAVSEYLRRFPGQAERVARAFHFRAPGPARTPPEGVATEQKTLSLGKPSGDDPATEVQPGVLVGRRYVVRKPVGKGGCAIVYLAHDPMLDRLVALKMPRSDGFRSDEELANFIREARNAAQLVHPGIVQTYDVQREPRSVFIVQQYIDGPNLSVLMKDGRPDRERVVDMIIGVAEALDYAHRHGFVHRDIKPANILIDSRGRAFLSDFGLALHESVQHHHWGELAGTCPYMSPEQVRREVHRLDGRSDLWSLGVILYELLAGARPFEAADSTQLFEEIEHREPRTPREVDPSVPEELSRICMKCLAKRAAERYASAAELIDDLRHWRGEDTSRPVPTTPDAKVVPRGLRSFDAEDADFFLELLPGPRDRAGLPEGLRFWKRQVERIDPPDRLAVCLMYGPSGSGKSSLVKAGLIPRLAAHVLPVYVEATPRETESRLLRALRKHVPDLPSDATLSDAFARLRTDGGSGRRKVLVVLDQFEQWLHASDGRGDGELVRALRQCDGGAVQCLLLVRDDFWMSTTRFMQALEIPQVEGLNSAAVDLFDPAHAAKVLRAFGRAFGRLPEGELAAEQSRFLELSAQGLARDGKVVSVRLALFAEMMKGRPWTVAELEAVGGPEGVDLSFLEQTFSAPTAPPAHRVHQDAARAVLKALLPEHGSDIRGRMQPFERLAEVSGYARRPEEFRTLLDVLDGELRLITPTEPGAPSPDADAPAEPRYYQLTHDFLVPSLRAWLSKTQRETRRGRAELRLEERTALWTERRERKQLPSWWEWVEIRSLTRRAEWTGPQRRMMREAARHHLGRAGLLLGVAATIAVAAAVGQHLRGRRALRDQARQHVAQLWDIDWRYIKPHLDRMDDHPELWKGDVAEVAARQETPPEHRTRGYLALARLGYGEVDHLARRLLEAEGSEQQAIRDELRRWKARVAPILWREATDPRTSARALLSASLALADYDPGDARWSTIAGPVVRALVGHNPLLVNPWIDLLRPVRGHLRRPLARSFADPDLGENPRLLAASILARFADADARYLPAEDLAGLVLDATPAQTAILLPLARRRREEMVALLSAALDAPVPLNHDSDDDRLIRRQANASEALLALGRDDAFWPRLRQSGDPRLRTELIERIPASTRWEALLARAAQEKEGSIRQAILLGLEGAGPGLSEPDRRRAADRLAAIYEADPDGGVHGAAEWVLGRWGYARLIAEAKGRLAGKPPAGRNWFIDNHFHTMIIIPPPGRFLAGSPDDEVGRDQYETQREATIDYTFAISAHEVTFDQYLRYIHDPKVNGKAVFDPKVSVDGDCPATFVPWHDAAGYCLWVSGREGVPEARRFYAGLDLSSRSVLLPEDHPRREGYRLPTPDEWEYAARAGSATSRFFGDSPGHLDKYAWSTHNSAEHTWPVGRLRPNPLGLFDVYGNAQEWTDPGASAQAYLNAYTRGGAYNSTERFQRSAMPALSKLTPAYSNYGFRIVKVIHVP